MTVRFDSEGDGFATRPAEMPSPPPVGLLVDSGSLLPDEVEAVVAAEPRYGVDFRAVVIPGDERFDPVAALAVERGWKVIRS